MPHLLMISYPFPANESADSVQLNNAESDCYSELDLMFPFLSANSLKVL